MCVSETLKTAATNLQSWDESVVGDLEKRIKLAKKDLDKCLRKPISQEKVNEETRLRCRLELLEEMNSTKWMR
jgi:5'-deoxynucleotidase YfbR-like HD superfamily hydrolase